MVLSRAAIRLVAVGTALVVAAAGTWFALRPRQVRHVTAHVTQAVGVYPGSDVRVLGVKIGTVTRVTPQGRSVRIDLSYDARRRIPADAIAVVVAPSLVSDRYVQLAPVYRGGPVLADGADIPVSRTATPVELDAVYQSLNTLAVALGPQGANRNGALSRLLDVGAANLDGTGAAINHGITDLDRAVSTLSAHRDDLFGSVRNLSEFTSALAHSDQQVRQFTTNLATVSAQLAGERTALAAAVKNLAAALGQVTAFVHDNQAALTSNLTGLAQLTDTLVRQRDALAEFLDVAPTALSDLSNAYDPRSGTLDTRNNVDQLGDPAYVCALLLSLPVAPAAAPAVSRCQQAAALSSTFARSLTAVLHAFGVSFTPGSAPPAAPAGARPADAGTPAASLPTIPGAGRQGGAGGPLPTIPGLPGAVDDVTRGLSDALNTLLGGTR